MVGIKGLINKIAPSFSTKSSGADINDPKSVTEVLWKVFRIIIDAHEFEEMVQNLVNSILSGLNQLNLKYNIVVLGLVNENRQYIKKISISATEETKKILLAHQNLFQNKIVNLSDEDNLCVQVLSKNKRLVTQDLYEILRPVINQEESQKIQTQANIKSTMIYPISYRGQTRGVLILCSTKGFQDVSEIEHDLISKITGLAGVAVQNIKLYSSFQDATHKLKKANEKILKANEQLQELDKLKDEFVTLASHELRTPITAIKGSLSTILEGFAGDTSDEVKEFLVSAYNENDRLLRLINNLLNISRIQAGKFAFEFVKTNINDIIQEVINNMRFGAKEKSLFLKFEKNYAVPEIQTDADKVKEVLINLIGNAIKYTHKGGVTVKVYPDNGKLVVSISDTGSGIAKEDQDLLFKKFSQVSGDYARPTGGTGVGLYICKKIIEGLKGKIWLDSTVGKGSTFYFSLPLSS